MSKAVRLADIAEILNVSTVTVSKALSDEGQDQAAGRGDGIPVSV